MLRGCVVCVPLDCVFVACGVLFGSVCMCVCVVVLSLLCLLLLCPPDRVSYLLVICPRDVSFCLVVVVVLFVFVFVGSYSHMFCLPLSMFFYLSPCVHVASMFPLCVSRL